MSEKKPIIIEGKIIMPYEYYVGIFNTRFFTELRDNKRIMGVRCPVCNWVYVPSRTTCIKCFNQLSQWVEVSDTGTLITYTIVNYSTPVQPTDALLAYGVIKLDGADSGLTHILGEFEYKGLKIGMPVKAVFREKRVGNILDISHFKPM